ncbi:MAG TPA: hypothetical protein VNL91_09450 [Thermoanaerobaculia bacterium]|nr:hypothetical protein [Thermoanaerobaculia bacterium]
MSSIFDRERDEQRAEYLEAVGATPQPLPETDPGRVLRHRLRRLVPTKTEARMVLGFGLCGLAFATGGSLHLLRARSLSSAAR